MHKIFTVVQSTNPQDLTHKRGIGLKELLLKAKQLLGSQAAQVEIADPITPDELRKSLEHIHNGDTVGLVIRGNTEDDDTVERTLKQIKEDSDIRTLLSRAANKVFVAVDENPTGVSLITPKASRLKPFNPNDTDNRGQMLAYNSNVPVASLGQFDLDLILQSPIETELLDAVLQNLRDQQIDTVDSRQHCDYQMLGFLDRLTRA